MKLYVDLGSIVGDDNFYRSELLSQLKLLQFNLTNKYKTLIKTNQSDLKDSGYKHLKQFKDHLCNESKEAKSYELANEMIEKLKRLNNEGDGETSKLDKIIEGIRNEKIGSSELFDKFVKNVNLLRNEPFSEDFDRSSFESECVRVFNDLIDVLGGKSQVLKLSAIEHVEKSIEENLKYLKSDIYRTISDDSQKAISVHLALEIYLNESSAKNDMKIEVIFEKVEKKLTKSAKYFMETLKGILSRLHELVLKTTEFHEEGHRIRDKILDGIDRIKLDLTDQCERAVQDEFNKIWDIFECDVEGLIKNDAHIYKLPRVFNLVSDFLGKLPRTTSEFENRIKQLDEQIKKYIPTTDSSHFKQTQTSLNDFLTQPNTKDKKLSESITTIALYFSEKLEKERKEKEASIKSLATNALRQVSNDLEFKIHEETRTKSLKVADELVEGLIAELKLVTFLNVKSLFTSLLEKTRAHLKNDTVIALERLEHDESNAEHLSDFFSNIVLVRLKEQSENIKSRLNGDFEAVKRQEMRKCFQDFINEANSMLNLLDESQTTKKFLESIKGNFDEKLLKSFSELVDLIGHLKSFWVTVQANKSKISSLASFVITSENLLNSVQKDYASSEIPGWAIPKLAMVGDQITVKIGECEESGQKAKNKALRDFDRATLQFAQGINKYILLKVDTINDKAEKKKELVEKLSTYLESALLHQNVKEFANAILTKSNLFKRHIFCNLFELF